MAGSPAAATFSGHTLFVRGKYSVPEPFDATVDTGSLVERRSCTAPFKFNIRD